MKDFIQLFNEIAHLESKGRSSPAIDMEDHLSDLGLDSMDLLVIGMYFCSWWGVDDAISKQLTAISKNKRRAQALSSDETTSTTSKTEVATLQEFYTFLDTHKTKTPPTLQEAIKDYRL